MNETLSIVDFRSIIQTVYQEYNVDLSNYALTSIKKRIERAMKLNNIVGAADLIVKIKEDRTFKEFFFQDISVEDTEMFRDPSMWVELKNKYLPKLIQPDDKIWVASSETGEELYTLAIVLQECDLLNKVQIISVNMSRRNIEKIRAGVIEIKRMEVNDANYQRYNPDASLQKYYNTSNHKAYLDTSLIDNVHFIHGDMFSINPPSDIKLVVFRNRMIYLNKLLQLYAINMVYDSMSNGGLVLIGIKENFENSGTDKRFIAVDKNESIYKK